MKKKKYQDEQENTSAAKNSKRKNRTDIEDRDKDTDRQDIHKTKQENVSHDMSFVRLLKAQQPRYFFWTPGEIENIKRAIE